MPVLLGHDDAWWDSGFDDAASLTAFIQQRNDHQTFWTKLLVAEYSTMFKHVRKRSVCCATCLLSFPQCENRCVPSFPLGKKVIMCYFSNRIFFFPCWKGVSFFSHQWMWGSHRPNLGIRIRNCWDPVPCRHGPCGNTPEHDNHDTEMVRNRTQLHTKPFPRQIGHCEAAGWCDSRISNHLLTVQEIQHFNHISTTSKLIKL